MKTAGEIYGEIELFNTWWQRLNCLIHDGNIIYYTYNIFHAATFNLYIKLQFLM